MYRDCDQLISGHIMDKTSSMWECYHQVKKDVDYENKIKQIAKFNQ